MQEGGSKGSDDDANHSMGDSDEQIDIEDTNGLDESLWIK